MVGNRVLCAPSLKNSTATHFIGIRAGHKAASGRTKSSVSGKLETISIGHRMGGDESAGMTENGREPRRADNTHMAPASFPDMVGGADVRSVISGRNTGEVGRSGGSSGGTSNDTSSDGAENSVKRAADEHEPGGHGGAERGRWATVVGDGADDEDRGRRQQWRAGRDWVGRWVEWSGVEWNGVEEWPRWEWYRCPARPGGK